MKIINLMIIICFISCSSTKNNHNLEEVILKKSIVDFINEYDKINKNKQLEALTIYVDKKGLLRSISISDAPKENINSLITKYPKLIGEYQNIKFELYGVENLQSSEIKNSSDFLIRSLKQDINQQILLEYNPYLQIEYKFKEKTKEMRLLNGEIRNVRWDG